MPFSKVWQRVSKNEVPLNVVWLSAVVAFIMALTVRNLSVIHLGTHNHYMFVS